MCIRCTNSGNRFRLSLAVGFSVILALVGLFYPTSILLADWSTAINISNSWIDSRQPALAMESNGTLHVVWEEGDYIYYADKPPDSNWSTPTAIPGCPQSSHDPSLVVDANNALHLVWWSSDLIGLYGVLYAFKASGGNWSSPVRIAPDPSGISGTDIAVDGTGTVHAVWSYPLYGLHNIFYASKSVGGSWSSPTNVSDNSGYSTQPSIVVDGSDTVHVAWEDLTYGDYEILYALKSSGGSWTSPLNVSNDFADSFEPSLAVDDADALHLVWHDNTWSVLYKARPIGGGWQATETIDSNTSGAYGGSVIAVKDDGKYVAWQSPGYDIFCSYKTGGGVWSSPENASNSSGLSAFSDLAVDGTGTLCLVWQDDTPGNEEIFYSSGAPATDDDLAGPLIGMPTHAGSVPSDEAIPVTVEVSDQATGDHGVLSATLRYGYTAPYEEHSILGSGPGGNGDGTWSFDIPAQGDDREGQTLRFSVEACDGDDSPACSVNDDGGGYFEVVIGDDDTTPPAFGNNAPMTATEGVTVLLQVDITDLSGVYDTSSSSTSVYLEWDTDGELDSDVAGSLDMDHLTGDTYRADTAIGSFDEGTAIAWHVWAEDDDNSRSGAWSPVYDLEVEDDDSAGPLIGTPTHAGSAPSDEPIAVTVDVSDQLTGDHGVLSATLRYGYTAPYEEHSILGSGPGGTGDGTWSFDIPAQGDDREGQTLRFSVEACDGDDSPACSVEDNGGSYFAVNITDDDTTPPVFASNAPTTVTDSETIFLQVDVTDPSGVHDTPSDAASVYLEWDTDDELSSDVAGRLDMDPGSGDTYRADTAIGSFDEGTAIVWHVWAEDDDNSRSGAWSPVYDLEVEDDDSAGPLIGTPTHAGSAPSDEPIAVTVGVSDQLTGDHGVFSATLRYGYMAPYEEHSISGSDPGGNGDGTWGFDILAQGDDHEGQTLRFSLEACDGDNSSACSVNDNGESYFAIGIIDDDTEGPIISTPVYSDTVLSDEPITVTVDIFDQSTAENGVISANLRYGYVAPYNEHSISGGGPGGNGDGTWTFVIPAQGDDHEDQTLRFSIEACDDDNSPACSTNDDGGSYFAVLIADDDTWGPVIGTPTDISPIVSDEPIIVTVEVSDHMAGDHGVLSTTLRYSYTAPYNQSAISGTGPSGNGDGAWMFVIPAQGDEREGQTLRFSLEACDGDNSPACSVEDNGGGYFPVDISDDDIDPPAFSSPIPITVTDSQTITFQVDITDPSGIYDTSSITESVYLEWDTDGELDVDVAGRLDMDPGSGNTYQADAAIGPFTNGTIVVWHVWAEDDDNSRTGAWSPIYYLEVGDEDATGPVIGTPTCASSVPSDKSITVTVEISDQTTGDHGVSTAMLHCGYSAPYNQYSVSGDGPGGNGDGTWSFDIPAQGDVHEGQTLRFSIGACDNDNSPACSTNDNGGGYFAVSITDDDTTPPAFSNNAPVTATDDVTILLQVDITDPSGVHDTSSSTDSVYLEWDTDGELESDVAGSLGMDFLSGDTYRANMAIGPFATDTDIVWHVWAKDDDNSRSEGWSAVYTVRVTDDDTEGPMIGAPSYVNSVPSDEPITVTVEVSDQTTGDHGVLTTTLHFGYTVPYNQHSIGGSGPGGDGDGIWTFIIPAQGDAYKGQTLRFSLEACDGDNSPVCSVRDNSGNYYAVRIVSSFEVCLPLVVRNS